jgi:hypothetical protein
LRVGNGDAIFQHLVERWQSIVKVRIFSEQRKQLLLARIGTGHAADEVNHGIAMVNLDVELIERFATKVLETLLHLHFDIVPREIAA